MKEKSPDCTLNPRGKVRLRMLSATAEAEL